MAHGASPHRTAERASLHGARARVRARVGSVLTTPLAVPVTQSPAADRPQGPRMLTPVVARSPDFARTASDYARHRAGFPPRLLDELTARGIARSGARVADLGTGTGSLARLFAQRGFAVTGVDIAAPLLEQAARLDREAGVRDRLRTGASGVNRAAERGVRLGQRRPVLALVRPGGRGARGGTSAHARRERGDRALRLAGNPGRTWSTPRSRSSCATRRPAIRLTLRGGLRAARVSTRNGSLTCRAQDSPTSRPSRSTWTCPTHAIHGWGAIRRERADRGDARRGRRAGLLATS